MKTTTALEDASEVKGDLATPPVASHFIRTLIAEDMRTGKYQGRVVTRFPPEPNGYLHIGHAKSICLNFGMAAEFGGRCHLRFDDTNPNTEDPEYVESIQRDIRWLGFDWGEHLYFASDYFEQLYQFAVQLIKEGKAYVCPLTEEEVREYRGTVNEPGRESPGRAYSSETNLDLFERMRKGEFPEGKYTLRARIDMSAANMKLRDPLLYRIRHAHHYRAGDKWCIYPMYDWAHPLSDGIEGVTHSICTLEFENNRDIYDWAMESCRIPNHSDQTEFARLSLTHTLTSKRKLIDLVRKKVVRGWDDPRMPTIAGFRRRGVTADAIRDFCERIGVAKANSTVEYEVLERCIREDLHVRSPRVMAVLRPLKVVIENYPEEVSESVEMPFFPPDVPREGSRAVPFSRELYIDRDDFMEKPEPGYFRLAPGREVRLRWAYYITCREVVKDTNGEILELRCTYDPLSKGGTTPDGRKVKGTLHWVPAAASVPVEVRLYERLFKSENPAEGDYEQHLNPGSLDILEQARVEPFLATAEPGTHWQFERLGYFFADPIDSQPGRPVFNRTVTLKDSWQKTAEKAVPVEATESAAARPVPARPKSAAPARSPEAQARLDVLMERFGLSAKDAEVMLGRPDALALLEATVAASASAKNASRWIIQELLPELKESGLKPGRPSGAQLAELISLQESGVLTNTLARQVLVQMLATGDTPGAIVERDGLRPVSDAGSLEPLIKRVLDANADAVERYRAGRTNLIGFFVGQVMKESGGKANAALVTELIRRQLA